MQHVNVTHSERYDLVIIGGGINGCGIAADAAQRGLRVFLCEQGDLGGATSSASSKLIHGGLRYLEHYEFRLVKEALAEREVLLNVAAHLARPQRFVMPHRPHLRPAWMIRAGLFLYDHLAKRVTLPAARAVTFDDSSPLKPDITRGFSYYDCWVDDARLVIANAQQARAHGATIARSTRCSRAQRQADRQCWSLTMTPDNGTPYQVQATAVVNAAGPWVSQLFDTALDQAAPASIRLIKGSHIVVPKLFDGEQAYILQNSDKRIVFALPYEDDFTLIGTTDKEFHGDPSMVRIDDDEIDYLLNIIAEHFRRTPGREDIVHSYSGVRPLMNDESTDPSAITRDYTLKLDSTDALPLLSIYGGKITTYRKLADAALNALSPFFNNMQPCVTADQPLPGSLHHLPSQPVLVDTLLAMYPAFDPAFMRRLARSYGLQTPKVLSGAQSEAQMGQHFGGTLYANEVAYLIDHEWAESVDDVLWRRTKQGLRLTHCQRDTLASWIRTYRQTPLQQAS